MSKVTEINKHIAEGISMSVLAHKYYQKVNPDKEYTKRGATNWFVRDPNIDFKVLRQVATEIYYDQLGLINIYEAQQRKNESNRV